MPFHCKLRSVGPAVLALLSTLPAQQRFATAGRVLDAAGQPVIGAMVTFVGSERPIGDRLENADRVVVITNPKGRFLAELLRGSDYSCWAVGPAAADGTRTVSEVADGVRPGMGFELRCALARSPSRVFVSDTGAWQHLGPLRFEVAVAAAHLHREPLVLVDGAADLPTLPAGKRWFLFAVDRAGNLLHSDRSEALAGEVPFPMPPPCEVPVRVRDANGAPVAGVSIHTRVSSRLQRGSRRQLVEPARLVEWRQVGTTGVDGTAVVEVPSLEEPFAAEEAQGPLLLASKCDYAGAVGGWAHGLIVEQRGDTLLRREIPLTLHAASSWRVRILDDTGIPLPASAVQLATSMVLRTRRDNVVLDATFQARAAEHGWLIFEGVPAKVEASTLLVHTPPTPVAASAVRGDSPRVPPLVRAPALLTPTMDCPFELDLRTLPMLTLKVRDTAGGPARNADVAMLPLPPDHWQPNDATHTFQLDALGSARTRVQPGRWSVFVTDRIGFAHTTLDVTSSADLALELQQLAVMHVRVLTTGELPSSAIEFAVNSSVHGAMSSDEAVLSLRAMSSRVNTWLAAQTHASVDGTFSLRFLDLPGSTFEGWVEADGRSARLRLEPSAEPIEFDLRAK